MVKYYYDDLLKAAYMGLHFGIEFNFVDLDGVSYLKCAKIPLTGNYGVGRFVVFDEKVFELLENDWIKKKVKVRRITESESLDWHECNIEEAKGLIACGGNIIMRDDKLFFMPKKEPNNGNVSN